MCMASTRAHSGWFTRSCVALPSTNPTNTVQNNTKTVQQPSNNRTQTVHKPSINRYNNPAEDPLSIACTKTPPRPRPPDTPGYALRDRKTKSTPWTPRAAPVPPPATLRYGAAGEAGGLPEGPPPPPGPQGRRRCHPSPHCATARRGRPEAYPKGRPNPAGPQGRRRRHLSSPCATARRERPEAYPKGRPYCQRSDPAPPVIGRGSKRAPTHRAGKSNRLM